jgi:filamentous hemagglutinin family protein
MKNNDKLVQKEEFRWSFRKKGSQVFNICKHLLFLMGFATSFASTAAIANPTGGAVVTGSATISTSGSTETINQTTQNAIINWNSFNIAKGETTQVNQPGATSTEIEQIFKSGQLSSLNGNLLSNGRIIIINPNGVIIGNNGNINTAGFIASSAGLANGSVDPNSTISALNFSKAGKANAKIINKGTITVADTGLVALVAPTVRNDGLIKGNLSKIQLGAADTFGVDFYGDGLINLAVGPSTKSRKLKVENNGEIIANGGQVLLTAAAASKVVDSVINNTGVIEANSLQNVNGQIVLKAPGATTKVSGKLQAKGGSIETSGDILSVADSATIEATNWLVDPKSIEIVHSSSTANSTYSTTGTGTGTSYLSDSVLDKALSTGSGMNITVSTSGTGNNTGNITVDSNANITLTGSSQTSTLTLDTSGATGTNAGNVNISGSIGATGTDKLGLTVNANGVISLSNATISTNGGSVKLNGATTLTSDETISAGSGNVTFSSTVDGAQALTVNAGSITADGAIGGKTALTGLSLTSTTGDIDTEALTLNNTFGGTTSLTLNAAGNVSVAGAVQVTNKNSYGTSAAKATLTANNGKVTVSTGGVKVAATGTTNASATLTVKATGDISLNGAVAATSDATEATSTGASTANVDIESTGGELYFSQAPVALAYDSQNTTGAQDSDAYDGLNYSATAAGNSSYATSTIVNIPANVWFNATTGTYSNTKTSQNNTYSLFGWVVDVAGTASVAKADQSSLTLSGVHTIAVTDDFTKQYAQDDSTATGKATANFNYIDPLNAAFDNTADASSYISSLAPTFSRPILSAADEQVASYDIKLGNLPSPLAGTGNTFNVTDAGNSTLTITPAPLTLVGTNIEKTYGDTVTYSGTTYTVTANGSTNASSGQQDYTITLGQLANHVADNITWSDSLTGLTVSSAGAVNNANVAGSPYGITLSGATGTGMSNYDINYGTSGAISVGKAALTITAGNENKTYGTNDVALNYTDSGLVSGDTVSGSLLRAGNTATNVSTLAGEQAGTYAIGQGSVAVSDPGNYNVTFNAGTFTINKAALTVTADNETKVYGVDDPTFTYNSNNTVASGVVTGVTVDGVAINDQLVVSLSRGTATQATEQVGSYAITGTVHVVNSGDPLGASPNYLINGGTNGKVVTPATLKITQAALGITGQSGTVTYGDSIDVTGNGGTTYTVTSYGSNTPYATGQDYVVNGSLTHTADNITWTDTITGLTVISAGTVSGAAVNNEKPYDVNVSGATGNGLSNYDISYAKGALVIAPLALVGTLSNADGSTYGDVSGPGTIDGGTVSFTNLVGSDVVTSQATVNYDATKNLSTSDHLDAGAYTETASALGGAAAGNYTFSGLTGGNYTVKQLALTGSIATGSSVYGQSLAPGAVTLNTVLADDVVNSGTVTVNTANNTSAGGFLNAGSYTGVESVGSTLSGTDAANYSFAGATGNYNVSKAALLIAANDQSKTYGTADAVQTYNKNGLVTGDTLSGSLSRQSYGTLAGEQVGTFAISQGSVAVSDPSNYTLTFTGGTETINAAALTVTANDLSKTYGTNDPNLTYGETGLVTGATVDGVKLNDTLVGSLLRDGTIATPFGPLGTYAGEQVGTYAINGAFKTLNPTDYKVTFKAGTETINAATLTVTASNESKTYGVNDPTLTYKTSGLVDGFADGVLLLDFTTGKLARANYGTLPGEQVGSYAIGLGSVGTTAINPKDYNIVLAPNNAALTINAAALTITAATNLAKTYGTEDPTLTYTSKGLVDKTVDGVLIDDTTNGALSRADYGQLAGEQVGSHAITLGTLGTTATTAGDYAISLANNKAALTINPAALTITAASGSVTYGDSIDVSGNGGTTYAVTSYGSNTPYATGQDYSVPNGSLTHSVDGITWTDTITGLKVTSAGTVSGAAVNGEIPYDVNASDATGTGLSNYSISYAKGALVIDPLALVGTLSNADGSTYGDVSGPGAIDGGTVSFTNLVGSDVVTSQATVNYDATKNLSTSDHLDAGAYTETASTLGGAAAGNYTFSGLTGGTYTVSKLALTGSIATGSSVYGQSLAPGAVTLNTVLADDVVNSGTVTVNTANNTSAGGFLNAGSYTGVESVGSTLSGTDAANYSFAGATGNYNVSKAALLIAANDQTKTYGTADAAQTYGETTGLVTGDTLSGSLSRQSYGTLAGEQVGTFAIGQGSVAVSDPSNYVLTFTGSTETITKATLTVTADLDQTKTYGVNDPALTYGEKGLVDATVDGVKLNDKITGDLSRANYGTLAGEQVGSFVINLGNLGTGYSAHKGKHHSKTVGDSDDYTIVLAENNAALAITPAALTIAAAFDTKTYDGTTDSSGAPTVTGLVDKWVDGVKLNDSVTATQAFDSANVLGAEESTIEVSGYTIENGKKVSDAGNYTVTTPTSSGTINPEDITITTGDVTKIYDGNTNVEETPSLIVTEGTLYKNQSNEGAQDTLASGTYAYTDPNAGTGDKTVVASGVTAVDGNSGSNYTIHYANNTTSTISQADLTVTADAFLKVFGTPLNFNGTEFTTSGTLYGQDAITGATLTSKGSPALALLGNYAVNASNATGKGVGNYDITYVAGNLDVVAPGTLGNAFNLDAAFRPILSVAGTVINNFLSFQPQNTGTSFNISLRAGQTASANGLSNIEPAAGGDDDADNSPSGLANIEPAAGGNGGNPGNKGDFACANAFLDGTACASE